MNRCSGRGRARACEVGHRGEAGRDEALHVAGAARVQPAVGAAQGERIAVQPWPSTGTVSTCPDSARPPAACGPMIAWMLAFCAGLVGADAIRHAVRVEVTRARSRSAPGWSCGWWCRTPPAGPAGRWWSGRGWGRTLLQSKHAVPRLSHQPTQRATLRPALLRRHRRARGGHLPEGIGSGGASCSEAVRRWPGRARP